jgi:hypothetical protein
MHEILIPSNLTAEPFGKVRILRDSNSLRVDFSILMEPQGQQAEGWQTGVALDASASMRGWYGRALEGKVPEDVVRDYESKGWVENRHEDGRKVKSFQKNAYEDAIQKGHLKFSQKVIQPLAQEFIAYLASKLDANGGTTVVYWACGKGEAVEVVGDFTEEQCRLLDIQGPRSLGFGYGTMLVPAVRYFVERFVNAKRGMFVFITDGKLDDLDDVKKFTTTLARSIHSGTRNPVKCVLVGVGTEIDESQMEQLDNLDTGTGVDIWDHKIATEMRGLVEIFSELVSENQIVAPTAAIYDSAGNLVKRFADGLPARAVVDLPPATEWFEIEVGGKRIRQAITLGTGPRK